MGQPFLLQDAIPENLFSCMSSEGGGVGWKRPLLAKSELSVVWFFRRLVVVGEQASLASSSELADRVWFQPTPSNHVIPGKGGAVSLLPPHKLTRFVICSRVIPTLHRVTIQSGRGNRPDDAAATRSHMKQLNTQPADRALQGRTCCC